MADSGLQPTDTPWLRRAEELAAAAAAAGNTPVGMVIVLHGDVIAEAAEECPAGPRAFAHAELLAVERALLEVRAPALKDATLYSTAEPCLMCGFAIREAGIGRLVLGWPSGQIGSLLGEYPLLTDTLIKRWGPPPVVIRTGTANDRPSAGG